MIKKTILAANLLTCLAGFTSANATEVCVTVDNESKNIGRLLPEFDPVNCQAITNLLANTGRFPSIFYQQSPQLPGVCFVSSAEGVEATLTSTNNVTRNVKLSSKSTFTSDFNPSEGDTLQGVITELNIKDAITDKSIGKIYSYDTLDSLSFSELDIVVSGSGKFVGAKGAIKIKSTAVPVLDQNNNPVLYNGAPIIDHVDLNTISGRVCYSG